MIEINYNIDEVGWKKNFPYFKKYISKTVKETINIIDFGMGPQEALNFPRAFHFNNIYKLEKTVDKEIFHSLEKIGHNVEYIDGTHGGGQAIKINRDEGDLLGGSDPRKDGYAKGY